MRYIEVTFSNGYCGCDQTNFWAFSDDISDGIIDECCGDALNDYAESYEYVATGWGNDFEDEEDRDLYYENCEVSWIEVEPDEIGVDEEDFYEMC